MKEKSLDHKVGWLKRYRNSYINVSIYSRDLTSENTCRVFYPFSDNNFPFQFFFYFHFACLLAHHFILVYGMLFEQSQDFLSLNIKNIWHCVTYAPDDVVLFLWLLLFQQLYFVVDVSFLSSLTKKGIALEAIEKSVEAMHNDIKKYKVNSKAITLFNHS